MVGAHTLIRTGKGSSTGAGTYIRIDIPYVRQT